MMWVEKCDNREIGKMRVRRRDTRIWFVGLAVFLAAFLFTFLRQNFNDTDEVEAANLANFDPGYIISDYQMSRYDAMTEEEIQAFLTAKNPCNNTNQSDYEYLTVRYPNLKWHFLDGHFVCLSEELFGDGEVIGEGETAAHIIWQAAQDYQINPQVLIVLLQKEQGLITDTYPNSRQYRAATGYGCPDTAACSSKYYGFKNQVRNAAAMFRTVLDGGWTNYPLGENYIQYNPNAECGGSVVKVRSLATSALYRYTPYQPNEGALAAGYGTAYCGSYGNRNFYHYFEDWFSGITDSGENIIETGIVSERTINDGWYQIYSKKYQDKVVDVRGGIRDGMKTAELIAFNRNSYATSNQVFYVEFNAETGYYNIFNPASSLYFKVMGENNGNNSMAVIVSEKSSVCEQDWSIEKDQAGYVTFISRCSGKVIDATSDGRIIIYSKHGGDNQKWQLRAVQKEGQTVEDGIFQITNDGKAFDISGGVSKETKLGYLIMFTKKDQDNQKFELKYQADEKNYLIENPVSGLYLTAGEKISVKGEDGSCGQKWVIEEDGNSYNIFNVCDRTMVTISDEKIGNNPALTTENNRVGGFKFEKVEYEEPLNVDTQKQASSVIISTTKDYQIQLDDNNTIDIYGGVMANMKIANLVVFPARATNNTNQVFRLKYDAEKEAYQIYNPKSGLYLDVERSGKENNSAVIGFNNNGGYCNQYWKLEQEGERFFIKSLCSNKLLSVSNMMYGASPRLVIYEQNSSIRQLWRLVEL